MVYTHNGVVYKQQTFISKRTGGWAVQDHSEDTLSEGFLVPRRLSFHSPMVEGNDGSL